VTIVGIGFFHIQMMRTVMKISDASVMFIIALALTIQLPFYVAMLYFGIPLLILDYLSKILKNKVAIDETI
jgi:hypothetical protein